MYLFVAGFVISHPFTIILKSAIDVKAPRTYTTSSTLKRVLLLLYASCSNGIRDNFSIGLLLSTIGIS